MAVDAPATAMADAPHWTLRLFHWGRHRLRPYLGWLVFAVCLLLAAMPGFAVGVHRWVRADRLATGLNLIGPMAVASTWMLLGWRRPTMPKMTWWRAALLLLLLTGIGLLLMTQLYLRWIPGPLTVVRSAQSGTWFSLLSDVQADFSRLAIRYGLWWQGVQGRGATQDDLIFAGFAGLLFWFVGILTAWLARRRRRGLLAALPALWITLLVMTFTRSGRFLIVVAIGLALLLHLLLEQARLIERWQKKGWDFSRELLPESLITVAGGLLFLLTLAMIMPSSGIRPISQAYYAWTAPVAERLDGVSERLFPEMHGSRRGVGVGLSGGLPNDFLLRAGPDLTDAIVMVVRTSDAAVSGPPDESPPPPGHYMRAATYTAYDGLGWDNPPGDSALADYAADQPWLDPDTWASRKTLVQSVQLTFASPVLYAAPEPVQASTDYGVSTRGDGDLVAMRARVDGYTVVSRIPAVSDATLAAVPAFTPDELPPSLAQHLMLPDTVTPRTRDLAAELTDKRDGPFAQAQAIEQYLRGFEYDLSVSQPPADVLDVADYFLFDLQRGYCDYYATAFVVLARLAGLPARFATGYAVGAWDSYNLTWTITEAEAHSWPEVYFPDYGWIEFEPTAGRPELARIGLPEFNPIQGAPGDTSPPTIPEPTGLEWNWQMLFWLLPIGLLIWGVGQWLAGWHARRQDPWRSLLRWGARAGRPMAEGETVREYGHLLADHVTLGHRGEPEAARIAAREVAALGDDVTVARYAPAELQPAAIVRAQDRWQRLRRALRRVRMG